MVIKVGVLELQGDFALHHLILQKIGVQSIKVKKPLHLDGIDGLVIPGGESTTMFNLIETFECWELALESKNTPSVIALTRQGVNPLRLTGSSKNQCSTGAYEILRTGENIKVTILATGSETSLASDVGHKLATDGIYSKIISMPCHELFDQQSSIYKNKI